MSKKKSEKYDVEISDKLNKKKRDMDKKKRRHDKYGEE